MKTWQRTVFCLITIGGWYLLWYLYDTLAGHWYAWPTWIMVTTAYLFWLSMMAVTVQIWWERYKVKREEECESSTT